MEELTARPLDLVIHIQFTRLEVDRLPGEAENFTPAEAEAEDEDPGGEQRIFAGERVGEKAARLDDRSGLDPPTARLGDLISSSVTAWVATSTSR
ncbi:hypothetical protein ACIBBD_06880 [Streptomyces sp. NPDC051315]|uniref:hypothetical protein n=1 Tax=Streptomyces sp. NPDC051315 TaxID=3365650 RepID=UPI0037BCA72A